MKHVLRDFFLSIINSLILKLTKKRLKFLLKFKFDNIILQLSKHLPSDYIFKKPNSLSERRDEVSRTANFHSLTCSDTSCLYINEKQQHDNNKLYRDTFIKSQTEFPLSDSEK